MLGIMGKGKFFTCVTKTHPNLSTYSRKTGKLQWHYYLSWKSPPQSIKIFVNIDFFTNVLIVWFVFVYTESYWAQHLVAPEKK